jgi:mRNA degradation ribonuclease J1/J2
VIGASVVTAKDAPIHASGHGWQEELKLMLNLTKPRYVMPFHGDHQRLRLHAEMAAAVGVDPKNTFRGRNGLVLEIDERGARLDDDIHAGVMFVDGLGVGEPDDVALRDRKTISADGIFIEALARPDYQLVLAAAQALEGSTAASAAPALVHAFERISAERRETSRDTRLALLARIRELGSATHARALQHAARQHDALGAVGEHDGAEQMAQCVRDLAPHGMPIRQLLRADAGARADGWR